MVSRILADVIYHISSSVDPVADVSTFNMSCPSGIDTWGVSYLNPDFMTTVTQIAICSDGECNFYGNVMDFPGEKNATMTYNCAAASPNGTDIVNTLTATTSMHSSKCSCKLPHRNCQQTSKRLSAYLTHCLPICLIACLPGCTYR